MTGELEPAQERNPLDDLAEDTTGAKTVQLFASLYLILIAFFIVLNSVSNQVTAKADAALESVYTTFRKSFAPNSDEIDFLGLKKLDIHSQEFYDGIKGLFTELVDFPGWFASQGGNQLEAELATAVLFNQGDVHLRPDQTRFLNDLADFLRRESGQAERTVEISFAVTEAMMEAAQPEQQLPVLRAAAFARELEDRGVPASLISTGVVIDRRDLVWLRFNTRRSDILDRDRGGE
ncbi:MAG: hypothetical protein H3C28_07000 [Sphingomonadales bacterium]|nr:hypothetical protein [Sphingomonadales bacterium]